MKKYRSIWAVLLCVSVCIVFSGCGSVNVNKGDMTWVIKSNYNNVVSITASFASSSSKSQGTGVLIYEGGYIATNAHVITKSNAFGTSHEVANKIEVEFWSDAHYDGTWKYTQAQEEKYIRTMTVSYNVNNPNDPNNKGVLYWNITEDLAIIKCSDIPSEYENNAVAIRNSAPDKNPLKMGEPVAAMGFTLGWMYRSSVGVVSMTEDCCEGTAENVDKRIEYAIYHDAVIFSGNSGGPLFDGEGRLVGLNTLIQYLDDKGEIAGLGFSIALSSRTILAKMAMLGIIE